jgi:signal transduction histidine kinase
MMERKAPGNRTRLRTWRTWLGAIVVAVSAASLTQVLLHRFFVRLNMLGRHVLSGALHAAIIAIPVILFLAWRSTAREERMLHRRVRSAESMRDDLTNMLVHDLKTPVISAGLALAAVLRDREAGECGTEHEGEMLEIARASLKRAEAMIGDILTVAKGESVALDLNLADVDLAKLARKQTTLAFPRAEAEELILVADSGCAPIPVRVDAHMMRRVIDNLLENAIKSTPAGGRIEVTAGVADGEAIVSVRDTGNGIPQELQGRIFEKYGQVEAARGGQKMSIGLGLVFCRLVVEAHGGRIWVESAPGRGSVFGFALPLRDGD